MERIGLFSLSSVVLTVLALTSVSHGKDAHATQSGAEVTQTQQETALWESIKDSKDADDYKAYLDKYPTGTYAPIAKRRIAKLEAQSSGAPAVVQSADKKESITAQASSQNSQKAVPVTMTECEGVNNCATWTFLGAQGNGQWQSGEIANLSVDHFDVDNVLIRRADSTGPSAGLSALYKGTRHGERIGGHYTSSWPGHWDNKSGDWSATIGQAKLSPPNVMRDCTTPDYRYCWTWTWNNGHYDGLSDSGRTAVLTVESFTPESVVLRAAIPPNYSSLSTGKISSQGNSILNGDWSDSNGAFGHFSAAWGTALQDLPKGKYQPPSTPPQRVVVCYPWFFSVVCQ